MERQWHNVVIENDEGDDGFLKAAPLLLEAMEIIQTAKTLTTAVQLSHRTNELFSRLGGGVSASGAHSSSPSCAKILRSIEALRAKQKMMYSVLDAILAAFVHVKHCDPVGSTFSMTEMGIKGGGANSPVENRDNASPNGRGSWEAPRPARRVLKSHTTCHKSGLLYPQQMLLDGALFTHATMDYNSFCECLGRLNDIAADPKLFTACEPRLRILKSRYALHSAYNGAREDQCNPAMGGGNVACAPKVDIRRLEMCISSRTLLNFIDLMCRKDPNYVVNYLTVNSNTDDSEKGLSTHNPQRGTSLDPNRGGASGQSEWDSTHRTKKCDEVFNEKVGGWKEWDRTSEGVVTVQDLVMRFWSAERKDGVFSPLGGPHAGGNMADGAACALTPEGLFLTPQYARNISSRWSSLYPSANGDKPIPSHVQQAQENLRNFLSIDNENQGDLFAKLVVPALSRVLHTSGSESDAIELEVTVNGREYGELGRIADWCVRSGILEETRLCFSIHITQDAFAVPSKDSAAHHDEEKAPWWWLMCQEHLSRLTGGNPAGQAETFQDVLQNIFEPIWEALLDPGSHPNLVRFLRRLNSFSISLNNAMSALQELPASSNPSQYTLHSSEAAPSNAFFVFHIQRNVQLLNCFTCAHEYFYRMGDSNLSPLHGAAEGKGEGGVACGAKNGEHYHTSNDASAPSYGFHFWNDATGGYDSDFTYLHHVPLHTLYHHHVPIFSGPLRLRLHGSGSSNSRTMFTESLLGLLVADEVVNPTQTFEWGPLTYLYYLTQRHLVLTPSRNQHGSQTIRKTLAQNAIPMAVQVGLNVSLATVDPLFFHNTDEALMEELLDTRKHLGLSNTDLTEMCLHSVESRMPYDEVWVTTGKQPHHKGLRETFFGAAWPRAEAWYNDSCFTQVSSLRLNFRDAALRHEVDLLCRKGLPQVPEGPLLEDSSALFTPRTRAPVQIGLPDFSDTFHSTRESQLTTRREWLHLFFGIPSSSFAFTVEGQWGNDERNRKTGECFPQKARRDHLEPTMRFPRIMIIGPKNESSSAIAKAVVRCTALRQHYQQYAVKPPLYSPEPREAESADRTHTGSHTSRGKLNFPGNMDPNLTTSLEFTSYKLCDGVIDVVLPNPTGGRSGHGKKSIQRSKTGASYDTHPYAPLPTWATFQQHARELRALSSDPGVQDFCSKRLGMLECKYNLHVALTKDDEEAYFVQLSSADPKASDAAREGAATAERYAVYPNRGSCRFVPRQDPKADIFNVVKVDVHCHMAGGFTAKSLLSFIKRKVQFHGDDIVGVDAALGRSITLREMFQKVVGKRLDLFSTQNRKCVPHLCARCTDVGEMNSEESISKQLQQLTIATLDVQAGKATFNRFDEFNSRYSPMRVSELRSLLLKTDNFMGGRYFAELIRSEVFLKNEAEGNIFTENRLSIYGRDDGEWLRLANWFVTQGMAHHTNRWIVQVPRLFGLYRLTGVLKNFEEMLWNVFSPLWEASLHPEKHPLLDYFLQHISGFDSVDNESSQESGEMIFSPPVQWTNAKNPPFAYYMYYMWANVTTLNRFRASKGLCTFDFRPHAGESGDPDHMADAFLVANGIGHGINLIKRPVLRYLYYLTQIPLAIVPLSNNALFCKYPDNPFRTFFRQGLNVSLGTDGALMFHNTEQPLLEEYTTAQNVWSLSAADVCEIAKRSVLMSGFSPRRKAQWLGERFFLHSVLGNEVAKSHLPMTRCALRYEVYMDEIAYLEARAAMDVVNRAMFTPAEENLILGDTIGCSRGEALARYCWGFPASAEHQIRIGSTELKEKTEHRQDSVSGIVTSGGPLRSLQRTSASPTLAQSQL